MRIYNYTLLLIIMFAFASCETRQNRNKAAEKKIQEIKTGGSVSDIIRNPVSANKPLDTINVAKMSFKELEFNFGNIQEGKTVEHTFKFKNDGKVPLIINDVRSTCGCTIPSWPKEAIAPGKGEKIKVIFKSEGKSGQQKKPVTITANTYPSETILHMNGTVNSNKK